MHGSQKRAKITNRRQRRAERPQDHTALLDAVKTEQAAKFGKPARSFKAPVIEPLTDAQRRLDGAIFSSTVTFAVGPAGVGKTWFAAARAAEAYRDNVVSKIIIVRPAVEAEENLGFLPGELEDKIGPYFRPVRDALVEVLGSGHVDYAVKSGDIEIRPLAYLRGASIKDAFILVDEAQNTTPGQMKLILTRVGEGCHVVVDGDLAQKDISGPSGLDDAMHRLRHVKGVSIVKFTSDDIVRSGFCQDVVRAYDNPVAAEPTIHLHVEADVDLSGVSFLQRAA